MYSVQTNRVKGLNANDYSLLINLSNHAGLLRNCCLYELRQYYFNTGKLLTYENLYKILKTQEHFQALQYHVAQQVLKQAVRDVKGFINKKTLNPNDESIKLPHYLKGSRLWFITIPIEHIRKDNIIKLLLSKSYRKENNIEKCNIQFKIPDRINTEHLKEVRITCYDYGKHVHVSYITKESITCYGMDGNVCGIDVGINNFCTLVASNGDALIIDGRKLKSYNRLYNKRIAKRQSYQAKIYHDTKHVPWSKAMRQLAYNRNNYIKDFMRKTTVEIIRFCKRNNVTLLVIGRNIGQKQDSKMNHVNNQNYQYIPYEKFYTMLSAACCKNNIYYLETEESYTSKSSFLDDDFLPCYGDGTFTNVFSGRRVARGLYRCGNGVIVNADVNAACNIVRKVLSKQNLVVLGCYEGLCRGLLASPLRHVIT